MGNLLSRLGMTGLIIVGTALIFGVLAGGIVVHRLETSPTASQSEQQQGESSDRQDEPKKNNHSHSSKPHPAESPEAQENDQDDQ